MEVTFICLYNNGELKFKLLKWQFKKLVRYLLYWSSKNVNISCLVSLNI